jgi:hypothetical protein
VENPEIGNLYARGYMLEGDEAFKKFFAEKQDENETRMANMESSIQELRGHMSANTLITAEGKGEIREVLDILRAVKGGLKVIGGIGTIVKWVAGVAGALVALYSMYKGELPWIK